MTTRSDRSRSIRWIVAGLVVLGISVVIAVLSQRDRPLRLLDRMPIRSNDIVLLGDSHFEYFDAAEMFNDKRIRNRGISAQTSQDMLRRVDDVTKGSPKKVLLLAGANDAFQGRTLDAYIRDMDQLIEELQGNTGSLAVLSIPPTTDEQLQKRFNEFNHALALLVRKKDVRYIDIRPPLEKNGRLDPALTYDGVHLNEEGYRRLLPLLKPFLKEPVAKQQ